MNTNNNYIFRPFQQTVILKTSLKKDHGGSDFEMLYDMSPWLIFWQIIIRHDIRYQVFYCLFLNSNAIWIESIKWVFIRPPQLQWLLVSRRGDGSQTLDRYNKHYTATCNWRIITISWFWLFNRSIDGRHHGWTVRTSCAKQKKIKKILCLSTRVKNFLFFFFY